jgi:DNA-dependent RNA polymerase
MSNTDYTRSRARTLKNEARRTEDLTFAGSLQGRALMHGKYLVPLTSMIGDDRRNGERDIRVWKALSVVRQDYKPPPGQDIDGSAWARDYHIAWRLLFAGIAVGYSNVDAIKDRDGEKNPFDQAIWIGRCIVGDSLGDDEATEKECQYRVGIWGARLLLGLNIFKVDPDNELLLLAVTAVTMMPVSNTYFKPYTRQLQNLSGKRTIVTVGDSTEVDKQDAGLGAPANFTHSYDAMLLMMVANAAAAEGLPLMAIHDCYGFRAPDAARGNELLREQYVELFTEQDPLAEIREQVSRDLPGVELPPLPPMGLLDLAGVIGNEFTFRP